MIGKVFDERFEILETLDKGGTSVVYRGIDRRTKNIVAVKVLNKQLSNDESYVTRFENEVIATLSLEHSNIVHVIDAGHTDDIYYLVMEYIDGKTVKDLINERGRLDIDEAVEITKCVCSALSYAHSAGFIHRDIKPQNIMIDKSGAVKITDFGIARKTTSKEIMEDDAVVGSVQYISPEQAKGEKTDKRSDIYSLGISLFEMITGKLPFDAKNYKDVLLMHKEKTMPYASDYDMNINAALSKVILKATQKHKRNRYHNMAEFSDHLSKVFEKPSGDYVRVVKEHVRITTEKILKARKRMFTHIAILTVFVLFLIGSLFVFIYFGKKANGDEARMLDKVEVPKLVGLSESDVVEIANVYGVQIVRQYGYSDDIKEGLSMSQSPSEGEDIILNGDITVVFSQGVQRITVPSVIDQHLDEAMNILTNQSLQVGKVEYVDSDKPDGYVVSQIPEADTLIPIDEEIELVVCKKTETDKGIVPDFIGLSIEELNVVLQDTPFEKCFIYLEEESENLEYENITIKSQSPQAESDEDIDSPIFLWMDSYKTNFHIVKSLDIPVESSDALLRITIKNKDNNYEIVMLEQKLEKGNTFVEFELKSFEAKEDMMCAYLNDELVIIQELASWRRKE